MLIIAAFAVTFGVFANGSMKATAPSLAEILGHFDQEAAMPQPRAKAVRTTAYRPSPVAVSPAVADAIKPKLHNAAAGALPLVDELDLSAALDVTAPLAEFEGRFDNEGWFTLGYLGKNEPMAPAKPAGSMTRNFAFSAPAAVRGGSSHAGNRSVTKAEHSKLFKPVVATLQIEGAVAAIAKNKTGGHSGLRASGSRNAEIHSIDLTITPEAAPVLEIEHASPAEITAIDAAAENGIFIAAAMPVALRPAATVKAAAPAEIIKAHYVASESLFTPIELAEQIAPAVLAGRTTRPVISKERVSGKARHFDSKASVGFGVKHPEVEAPEPVEEAVVTEAHSPTETAPAVESPAPAEAPKLLEPAAVMLDARHGDATAWLSSYLTTSPEVTATSLDRPKAVTYTPRKAAAAVVTGMTTLNVAPMKRGDGSYCDPNYVGEPIRFSQTAELKLEDLLLQIHNRFGVNFVMGPNVGQLPINIKAGAIPWNVLLRSQLFISGVRAKCIDQTTIELVENSVLPSLQDQAEVKTRFVKLKFLQRTGGGTVDLANRSQGGQNGGQGGGCGGSSAGQGGGQTGGGGQNGGGQQGETAGQQSSTKFDKLIIEIEKILGIRSMTESSVGGGGGGGQTTNVQQAEVIRTNRFVTQIPGRNILAIRATDEEHELIDQIIARADRPPFQVVIKALVYTANQDKLYDVGVRTTIFGGTADRSTRGGVFGHTLGAGGTLFDFSTIIGTFDFNVQATALQQNGVISVKSRPFATVLDGLCTTLNVGRSIPIVIDSTLGGQGDVVFVDASNNLAVTPYVIDDDNGDPMAVTLELRLGANDVDTSVTARDIPAISQRSIQTQLLLGEDKTAILGGFTVDSDTRTVSKTPGLGDIPLIGELFKRRVKASQINRLYFAISASVVPFGEVIRPVEVPGATTDPPSVTPQIKERSDKAEPKQVKGP